MSIWRWQAWDDADEGMKMRLGDESVVACSEVYVFEDVQ